MTISNKLFWILLTTFFISILIQSCTLSSLTHIIQTKKIKKEGPAIYISSNSSALVNQKILIYPVMLGPNCGELGLNMATYIKECLEKWHLFSQVNITSISCNNIFSAINKAKKIGYNYMIWLDCPILLPPGTNPDEPGEMKLTLRIVNTQTQNTCWYVEEKLFWFNNYNAWIINNNSQEIPKAIKEMLTIICHDWHDIIMPKKDKSE